MTTYFDLARLDQNNRICHVRSRLQLSMSSENAARLLGILGAPRDATFLEPAIMQDLLECTVREQSVRNVANGDSRARYELPRLVQLQCLFHAAAVRGYGVMVWEDS